MKKGWELKKLGEVCKTGSGGTPLKMHKDYYLGGKIPWLLSGEVSQGEIFVAKNFITENGLKNSSARLFPPNTVLIAMYGATAGQVGILRFEAATNQAVCGIFPNNTTIPEFLYYCFLSKKEELIAQAVGGAQPNISQIKIKNTLIPIPPLQEQQRIVSILDEAFVAIDKAKANAEKNLKNAKELFESYLQGVFENKGNGWEEHRMKEVCTLINGRAYNKEELLDKGKYAVLRVGNFFTNRGWYFSDLELPEDKYCVDGDLLYAWSASFGPRIWRGEKVIYHYHIWKVVPNLSLVTKEFLFILFEWDKEKIKEAQGTGATMMHVSKGSMEDRLIPIPSLEEQAIIVNNLDAISAETKRLESIYQQKLTDLEELKKSILQKAFNGELNTADLCA
jgi:type I restriction enzyme S subunit